MILDFTADSSQIKSETVGGKYYNLYQLNKIPGIHVPFAFCITDWNFDPDEVISRIDLLQMYAVRSSAREEDQIEYSAAGIFESYLNVQGEKAILKAIKQCFIAANSAKARAYYRQMKQGSGNIKMSVIIQEMVPALKSGVFFTRNPLNQVDEIYVEMVDGLGEKLVSGAVNPQKYVLNKDADLKDALLKKLRDAAGIITKVYKDPQDVEWAWYNGDLFILQSRPIVTVRKNTYWPEEVWTRANIGEIIPKPLTPLSLSIFNTVMSQAYRIKYYSIIDRFFTNMIHMIPRKSPVFRNPKSFTGHLYLNLETILKAFGAEPWVTPEILELGLGFTIQKNIQLPKQAFANKVVSLIKNIIFIIEYVFPFISMEKRALHFLRLKIKEIRLKQDENILDSLLKINRFAFGWHIAATARSFSHLGLIIKINRILKASSLSLSDLISILSTYNEEPYSKEINLIYTESLSLERAHDTQNKFSTNGSITKMISESFLNTYGHRSVNEFELAQPSWQEDPLRLMDLMQNFKYQPSVRSNLKKSLNTIQKLFIRRLLAAIKLREGLKSELIKEYKEIRAYYLRIAEQLVTQNILDKIDDIFFLDYTEIDKIMKFHKKITFDLEKRRKDYEDSLNTNLPQTFYGSIPLAGSENINQDKSIFNGLGCSPGFVSGKACIVDTPENVHMISEDSIILTKSADPGWIPVLLAAKGMIAEYGGILSHIASIAREHQKPLIVGIENITQLIRNGETIMMDGKTGRIEILS